MQTAFGILIYSWAIQINSQTRRLLNSTTTTKRVKEQGEQQNHGVSFGVKAGWSISNEPAFSSASATVERVYALINIPERVTTQE